MWKSGRTLPTVSQPKHHAHLRLLPLLSNLLASHISVYTYIFLCVGVFAPAPHLPSRLNPSSKVFFTRMWAVEALG